MTEKDSRQASSANHSFVDEFCDTVWLEDGLSKNTLDAYRRDLLLFARWLEKNCPDIDLLKVDQNHLNDYFWARHAESKATSANRRLTVLKRFYRLQLRLGRISENPCLKLKAAKQAARFPKSNPADSPPHIPACGSCPARRSPGWTRYRRCPWPHKSAGRR